MKLLYIVTQVEEVLYLIWMAERVIHFLPKNRLKLLNEQSTQLLITEVFSSQEVQERETYRPICSSSSVWQPLPADLVRLVGAKCF